MSSNPPSPPQRNLPLLLLQARERVMARFRPILNAHGITEQQWRVVRALNEAGPLEPRVIGEICCISSPSMAGILARMEDLGLVSRKRLEQDQRRVRVSLTPSSKALVEQITPLSRQKYQELEAELGCDSIAALYAQLDRLLERLPPLESQERPA
jgi:homoprotocatechuate degradation regulator HpaR